MSPDWVAFDGPLAKGSKVHKEVTKAKLDEGDVVRLGSLLDRVARGQAIPKKDFKHLDTYGLWEVRFSCDRRIFRLLYSAEAGKNVLVAVLFTQKKSDKLPKHVFRTAQIRLQQWRASAT